MKIEQKSDYILFDSEESVFTDFNTFFANNHENFANHNIFVYLSSKVSVDERDISVFLQYADSHKESGTTFVIICQNIDVDNFPESFNIAPTLQEAEDILEMENIQRDLGF